METHYLELRAAKRDSITDFEAISKEKFVDKEIFCHAINYANESASFKRAGKKMELIECKPDYLVVKITSETSLQMVSKSLAGFSRELIRVDDIRKREGKSRLFEDCVYNHTVFKSKILMGQEKLAESIEELSDASALKLCIDLFYGNVTRTKEQMQLRKESITQIKQILVNYAANIES